MIEDLETRIQETNGHIEVEELPTVNADPYQMRQLFQNLIGNSLKFHGEERPLIRVSSRTSEDRLFYEISVEDNGIGFEEKDAETIFMPFKRLHGRNSAYKGTGIGLSICQRIVERHGGTITAKSNPGKGSTFIVTLPAMGD
jgi:signal transduction histidine kinase